jgi:hypothetical protein
LTDFRYSYSLPEVLNVQELKRWNKLRLQLLSLTEERGQRLALAEKLKVSKQVLHGWLSGNKLPTAEHTLHLREWANPGEAENKTPDNVDTTVGSKQARTKVNREKHKSSSPSKRK